MTAMRIEQDSLGPVNVPGDKLWGAQTQRSLEYFSIGKDLMPSEMIASYAILKKGAANANHAGGRLGDEAHKLIVQACDEILAGQHQDVGGHDALENHRPLVIVTTVTLPRSDGF